SALAAAGIDPLLRAHAQASAKTAVRIAAGEIAALPCFMGGKSVLAVRRLEVGYGASGGRVATVRRRRRRCRSDGRSLGSPNRIYAARLRSDRRRPRWRWWPARPARRRIRPAVLHGCRCEGPTPTRRPPPSTT